MRDQEAYIVNDFRGNWNRTERAPKGYGLFSNIRFKDGFVFPREAFNQSFDLSPLALGSQIVRHYPFRLSSAPFTKRYLVLTVGGGNGRIYDTGSATPSTPIMTKAGLQDFSLQILYDRAFITLNTGARGMTAEFVYIYDPGLMTSPRKAAGLKPATALTPAVGAAGLCAPGVHLVTYAYETNTGFITKYATPASVTIPAGTPSIITLTGIANGPAGTVKKHLLMTRRIENYDGNPDHYEFFFAGVINDNVTTTGNINLYDTQLVSSGSYLLNLLEEIPAALGIGVAFGSLITWNEAADASDSLIRVSKPGDPESFNSSSGFLTTGKGEGGRLQNAREYRGVLYTFKGRRTYGVQPTDGEPNTWPVQTVDDNKGTSRFGIAEIVDAVGNSLDFLIINCFDGIYPFDGTYPDIPLTYAIETSWRGIVSRFFSTVFMCCDPVTKRIFVSSKSSTSGAYNLFVCDYSQGLSYDRVRWIFWTTVRPDDINIPHGPISMHLEPVNVSGEETTELGFIDVTENGFIKGVLLNEINPTNGDTDYAGDPKLIFTSIEIDDISFNDGGISSFLGFRLRGVLSNFDFSAETESGSGGASSTGLSTTNRYKYNLINVVTEKLRHIRVSEASLDFGSTPANKHVVEELIIYGKPIWAQRPM